MGIFVIEGCSIKKTNLSNDVYEKSYREYIRWCGGKIREYGKYIGATKNEIRKNFGEAHVEITINKKREAWYYFIEDHRIVFYFGKYNKVYSVDAY